jgi:predicted kinase
VGALSIERISVSKLIINRGLPGSGKSTQTFRDVMENYEKVIRVNRDDLRKMLHNSVWLGNKTEGNVIRMRDAAIRAGLKSGQTVISDDTNLDPSVVKHLAKIAEFFGAEVEVRDFDVPLNICIDRNSKREGSAKVPDEAIRGMHKKWFKNGKFPENPLGTSAIKPVTFAKYVPDKSLSKAVIFDIDGTLASHDGVRSPYDYTKVSLDNPREAVIETVKNYLQLQKYVVIFLSGREDSCRKDTITWLEKHIELSGFEFYLDSYWELHMRQAGDKRQDRIVKGELFDEHIRNRFNVEVVYDDRDQVVDLWRTELGLNCFQVNYGAF